MTIMGAKYRHQYYFQDFWKALKDISKGQINKFGAPPETSLAKRMLSRHIGRILMTVMEAKYHRQK